MRAIRVAWVVVLFAPVGALARGAELPQHYFQLLAAEVKALPTENLQLNPGAMFAAAVLFMREHPANPARGDGRLADLAVKLGDLLAAKCEADTNENKQDYEWEIHFWLDTYRLLEARLGEERRVRWRREMEKITRWFAGQVAYRLDFPRFQGPYIRTSTNHLALFASTVYLAGKVLRNEEWERLGGRAMHRLACEEQAGGGYWGEFTDNGPATGYNYITLCCVALYAEHSFDPAAGEALRRAGEFHRHFTWPDGTPVETINGRNRHWEVSAWGQFGFSHSATGRRYAQFLAGHFAAGKISSRNLGRLAQSALYYHDGPIEPIPQDLARSAYSLPGAAAGIRRTAPWTVCLSGLIEPSIDSQFTLDRQGHLSVFHDRLGLVVTGANSKQQPELATFADRSGGKLTTIPLSSRLRMSDDRDRLGLAYNTFFAELEVPQPSAERLPFRFAITETGRGRLEDAELHLQLCLKAGAELETSRTKVVLSGDRVELTPEQIGGILRHRGWTLTVDPAARLTWPVLPFNPYANAPETDLRHAVGVLTVPVKVLPPAADSPLNWRRGEIAFTLEADAGSAADPGEPSLEAAFRIVEEAVSKGGVPGAVGLVAHRGEIVREGAYGLADVEKKAPFTHQTLCWIASITKPVTVAAAMKLVEAGKLGLDDSVEKYLPEFKTIKDQAGRHHAITIRQLMSHTSGIQSSPPTRPDFFFSPAWLERKLSEIPPAIAKTPLLFPPGSRVQYSNAAPYVLGRICELQSGRPFHEHVRQAILEPTGMRDSYFILPAGEAGRVAVVYRDTRNGRIEFFRFDPKWQVTMTLPDGGLFATPREIQRFLQVFLDDDGRVLARDSVRAMRTEQAPGWGLGWGIEADGLFHHSGSSGTSAWADPQTGVIGILFFQLQNNDKTAPLQAAFRQAVREAYRQ